MEKSYLLKLPGMVGGGIKENNGGSEFKYNIFDTFKNISKCHNVLPMCTIIKKKIKYFLIVCNVLEYSDKRHSSYTQRVYFPVGKSEVIHII
jgi:hypothetical protein